MIRGNKGEWSELYVLIKLLAEGKIYCVGENLQKDLNCYLPVRKIFRDESNNHIEYFIEDNFINIHMDGAFVRKISCDELLRMAEEIFGDIVGSNFGGADKIMNRLSCKKLKADSSDKTDIKLQIYDPVIGFERVCGWSIKSDVGSSPTLFNASQRTNFIFEISNLGDEEILAINAIDTKSKVKDRVRRIGELKFVEVADEVFSSNLKFIDMQMGNILAEMLKLYYAGKFTDCADLTTYLEDSDPFNLRIENIYRHKVKNFLYAVALGLQPSKVWTGNIEANGGYIIVKKTGEIFAYHLQDRDSFSNYLLNNTKFDTGSATRHKFGKIYFVDGKKYINLNLQIRFK